MTPGQFARRVLGPAFRPLGEAYRRIFVDMAKIADWMVDQIPPDACILDVGGGDGLVVSLLLDRRSDISVTMTDLATDIGSFIPAHHLPRVTLLPGTDASTVEGNFEVVTIADVIHHVPHEVRTKFLHSLGAIAQASGARTILVKDIMPGNARAWLSLFSDLYITGDKTVSLIAPDEIQLNGFQIKECAMPDFPNYCLRFDATP